MTNPDWWKGYGLEPHEILFSPGDRLRTRPFPGMHMVPFGVREVKVIAIEAARPWKPGEIIAHPQSLILEEFPGERSSGYWWEKI